MGPDLIRLLKSVRLVVFDFDGVFTDNTVAVTQVGQESVRCWRSDGLGLARLNTIGVGILILSTEANPVVTVRANKLKIACKQEVDDKAGALLRICEEQGVPLIETAFVGNDINDIPALKLVGLPIAVADAYSEIFPHVVYRTARLGGLGAVREICDLIFHAKEDSLNSIGIYAS
jgi:3-deoxy-D-manno-octulosonate 8-phosphate phosphatase (KDO 8-P phosphatase)